MCDTFIKVVNNGNTMGKLRMAIKEKLLLAREAIAAIIVSMDASPKLPMSNETRKSGRFMTRLPISNRKKLKERTDRMDISRRL